MRIPLSVIFCILINLPLSGKGEGGMEYETIKWSLYSELPFPEDYDIQPGLAGTFSGLVNNKLVVAGGVNYPDGPPQEGGKARYWSDVYLLSPDDPDEWSFLPGVLPRNLANGVSITLPEGLLFIGGMNEYGARDEVFLLTLHGAENEVRLDEWPSLPVPLANMTGSIVGNKIYVAGGYQDIVNPMAENHFFLLDLGSRGEGWKSPGSWPGPPRSFAVSASQNDGLDNCFYLFGGIKHGPGLKMEFLSDGYEYNTRLGNWKRLDDSPGPLFPVAGGAAFSSGANHILFTGGFCDGVMEKITMTGGKLDISTEGENKVQEDEVKMVNDQVIYHLNNPGDFCRRVLFYHTITNTIVEKGKIAFPVPLTGNAVKVGSKVFVPGRGEAPGEVMATIVSGELLFIKTGIGWWSIIIMFLYFLVLTWMGWVFSRRQKDTTDYFKGGHKMSWWVVALSIYGTTTSSIGYMSIPAKAYATDWNYMIYAFGMILCLPVIAFLFIPFYRKLNVTTAYEYLEMRFNVTVRVLTSLAFMIFQIGRMGIVLFLPALAINVITGFDIYLCIVLMGVISLIYTTMGGIQAVIWTDAIQLMILFGAIFIAIGLIMLNVEDGFLGMISIASADGKFHLADTRLDLRSPTLITVLIATFFANVTTYGTDQAVVQRYFTTPTEKMAIKSVWTKILLTIPGAFLYFFLGTSLYAFYKSTPSALSFTITDGDGIFPWFIFTQMPSIFSAILLSGLLAAAMSTVSSSINSGATAYSVDIHFRFGWMKKVREMTVARVASILFGVAGTLLAMFMATMEIVSLWDQFIKILGLLMGSFGGLFLLGLLTRRANSSGAIIGIIASLLVQLWIDQNQAVHVLLYVATGSLTCFIVGYLASLIMPDDKKDISNLTVSN